MEKKSIIQAVVVNVIKIAIAIVIIMVIYNVAAKTYQFGYSVFSEEAVDAAPGTTIEVTIVQDKSVKDIGTLLEEAGLVKSGLIFWANEWFSPYHEDIQPGVYQLNTSMIPSEMIAIMSHSDEMELEELEEMEVDVQ